MGVDVVNAGHDKLRLLVMQSQADLLVGLFLAGIQCKFLAKFLLGNALKTEHRHILRNVRQFQRKQVNVPLCQLADLIVRQPEGFDLILGQLVGNDAGNRGKAKPARSLITGMPGNDLMFGGNHQRDKKTVLPDAGRHRIHRIVIFSRIVFVRVYLLQREL